MTDYEGHLDRKSRTVTFHGTDVALDELKPFVAWLRKVESWMQCQQDLDDGGYRWTFKRGKVPTAQLLFGRRPRSRVVPLVSYTARAEKECDACEAKITKGERAWKQVSGSWGGHSRERFCNRCVERGEPPCPPRLRVVNGGAA